MLTASVFCQPINDVTWLRPSSWQVDDRVAIYRVKLAEFEPMLTDLFALLLPAEKERASRYHRSSDQHRFVIVRGVLKSLLGMFVNQSPVAIQFEVDSTKKPTLKEFPELQYNVSHSGGWALLAIAGVTVGVDVEKITHDFSFQDVMQYSFSQPEQEYVGDDPQFFYQLWTRKEALLKATAKGIDDQLARVPALDGRHDVTSSLIGQSGNWFVGDFSVAEDYRGAVAYSTPTGVQRPAFYYLDRRVVQSR